MKIFPSAEVGARSLQAEVREEVLAGGDVLSFSKTGAEERTLAYLQPCYELLDNMYKGDPSGDINVLVLVPTRKVATRVRKQAERLGEAGGYKAASCFHSMEAPLTSNMEQLQAISTATILVATPCKLKDLITSRQVDLSQVFYLVLDGADKMVQMGLEPQVRDIVKRVPRKRRSLVFSESHGGIVKKLAQDILSETRDHLMQPSKASEIKRKPQPQYQPEVRPVKRPAESPPPGQTEAETGPSKTQRKACPAPAAPIITPSVPRTPRQPADQGAESSAVEKGKYLTSFGLCPVSQAEEIR